MPQRLQRGCAEPGCGVACDGPFCPKHAEENYRKEHRREYDRVRKSEPTYRMYTDPRFGWERFKTAFASHGNVICQRLVDGVRCTRPVEIRHHVISPRIRPDLFTVPSNVVGVCYKHHSDETLDDPSLYTPTLWRAPYVGGPVPQSAPTAVVSELEPTAQTPPSKPSSFVVSSLPPDPTAAARTASLIDRLKNPYTVS